MIAEIVQGLVTAMTEFVPGVGRTLVDAFSNLFWVAGAEGATGELTLLAQGLLAVAGISLVIGCVKLIYGIFRGRLRKSM